VIALILAPLICGVIAGYACGGRLSWLAKTRIRAPWLLILAAGLQFVHFRFPQVRQGLESAIGISLMVPIFILVGAWILANLLRRPPAVQAALLLIVVGGTMNAVVIAANGRMPYSEAAARAANQSAEDKARAASSPKHLAADSTTKLGWFGDVIPVRPIGKVVSPGDVILLLGVGALVAGAMRSHPADQPLMVSRIDPAHRSGIRPPD
jgi:hypothetical protein